LITSDWRGRHPVEVRRPPKGSEPRFVGDFRRESTGSFLAITSDGNTMATNSTVDFGGVGLWDVASGELLGRLAVSFYNQGFAFLPDGRLLAAAERRKGGLWK